MNGKRLSVGISLLFTLSGVCLAAVQVTKGAIEFQGSIVEPSCTPRASERPKFELNGCPAISRTSTVNVIRVETISIVSSPDRSNVKIKPLTESGLDGREYDQQYVLVDAAGTPVRSGTYLITLSMP